jgi:hypothetical protein
MGDKKTIYPVGDSHAWHGWLKIPEAEPYTVGPMTVHHFGTQKPILTEKIPMDAIVVFCWGEIDCRCHIFKHPPFLDTINTLVKNYQDAIRLNVIGRDPSNIWVYNIVPPPRKEQAYSENPNYPFLGSNEERLFFVNRMNDGIRKFCFMEGYKFVNTYAGYCDDFGFMIMEKSDGHVHIADLQPLRSWIDANS